MSKIFISHSSVNNAAALAVAQWLAENGWDDFFLDIEPARGLSPGERWQEALRAASDRCEAVLCLISPAWRDSRWCLAELLLAKQLGKVIFGAFIEPTPPESLPREMTAEWQLCDLVEGSARRVFQVGSDPIVPATTVSFAIPGLDRLRLGLQRAGLDAATFPWPPANDPDRAPYRGFKALEAEDAAMFFGREAEMVRGLDTLRRLREWDVERMLILLGASGAGKSSFLRAGLWSRLSRDDRRFLTLPVIRPERAAMTGPSGLAASLEAAFRGLRQLRSRADIRSVLAESGGMDRLLAELQSLAVHRLGPDASPPAVILGVDQAEELFSAEGQVEAETFLSLLAQTLDPMPGRRVMAVLAIRSDSFERLQAEPLLERARWTLFDLRPLARAEYKAAVEGPAARATAAGRPLRIDPELTERLLGEADGADALPLLAFTLERLFVEHGGDGALSLPDYEALGGLRGSIEEVVKTAFAEPGREPMIPPDEAERMRRLKEGFIPWLARIDPDTEERKRRVARLDELPAESRSLIERLISARLLLSDRRKVEGNEGERVVVEVAHEALLRQWPTLTAWLNEAAAELKALEATRRAAGEWSKNDRRTDWLTHTGDRLRAAEALRRRPDFDRLLKVEGNAYLEACRQRDDLSQVEREAQARRVANAQRRSWVLLAVIAVVLLGAGSWIVYQTREVARQTSLVLATNAQAATDASRPDQALRFALLASRRGWLSAPAPEAEAQLARAAHASRLLMQFRQDSWVGSASFSPDGRRVVVSGGTEICVLDTATGKTLVVRNGTLVNSASFSPDGRRIVSASAFGIRVRDAAVGKILAEAKQNGVTSALFSPDGRRIVSASAFGIRVWDAEMGKILAEAKQNGVTSASFSPDGQRVVSASWDGTVRVWDVATRETLAEVKDDQAVNSASFSPDGQQVVIASLDGTVRVWDLARRESIAQVKHDQRATSASFSPDGRRVVSASWDGAVRVWDVATREIRADVKLDRWGSTASFSPDGRRVVSASSDGTVRVWDVSARENLADVKLAPSFVSLSPDGRRVVSTYWNGTIRVWDAVTRETLTEVKYDQGISSAAFSPDGTRMVSASSDGAVRVWNVLTGQVLAEGKHSRAVKFASFSPDGRRVVSASYDGIMRVWDAATGRLITEMKQMASSASFSPDGRMVVSSSSEGLRVWNALTGQSGAKMEGRAEAGAPAFSLDGRRVLGVSFGTFIAWDAATGILLKEVKCDADTSVSSASLSPDRRRVIGVLADKMIIWDVATGQVLAEMKHKGVKSASFSPDGRRVVTASDLAVRVWNTQWLTLDRPELIAAVCREKLRGAKELSSEDVKVAPILRGRNDKDVCAPPTWLDRLKDVIH